MVKEIYINHVPFVHLHTHSEYSVLDGASKIDDLIEKAIQYRMPALALTDHGNMFGALEFYEKASSNGLKPIIGEEFYLAPGSMLDRVPKEKAYHLVLLARDEEGYRNLLKLSSEAFLNGYYYRPRVDKQLLAKYSKGLLATSSCLGGEIPSLLLQDNLKKARNVAGEYIDIFGIENFYFELMDNGLTEQQVVNRKLLELAGRMGIKLVATNDIHYLNQSDAFYHDVLLCIQTGKSINEKNRLRFKSDQFYFRSPQEMMSLFSEVPQAIKNSIEIAEKCNLSLELGKPHLPHFPIPEGETAESYLKKLTEDGLRFRYGEPHDKVKERAKIELSVISSMGFCTYFLIVWDFITFARNMGIMVGPGRGSAAGSIVAYALQITDVDPLKYGLLFERFLNPSRISMPDIDIDFDGDRRDEVIQYVREKYGEDRVAQIITFGAMKARAVVRDVARALEISVQEADSIAKLIPFRHDITIDEALQTSKELKELIQKDFRIKRLFEISRKLERLVRHPSTHAAGVVIAPESLTRIVPLYKDPKSNVISTQYQAKHLEDVGLIKMDFLGLKNLTVIKRCLEMIEKANLPVPDISMLDLEDKAVYELLATGKSLGVFQLESSGMQNLLKRLCPTRFDDIIAVLALYRPGPLDSGMVDEFIARKQGIRPITYSDAKLKEILRDTYGVIVYQEQVMEIARKISGFTMAEADNLRKAMGKKKPELLEEARNKFVKGAVKEGVKEKTAEEIFEMIKTFGRYGFNKSHSTAYALLAYQTAYLKAHYPVFYLASLLSGELHDTDKISQYIQEAQEMGIEVKGPSVNSSGVRFEVEGESIIYALAAIKNVGESAARLIVEERLKGDFNSIFDFTSRIDLRLVNRRVLESLIKSGAMDCFGETRKTLYENIDLALEYGAGIQSDRMKGQSSLFEETIDQEIEEFYQMETVPEWEDTELSEYEKEAMGFYFKAHPVLKYREKFKQCGAITISRLKDFPSESQVVIFAVIVSTKRIVTKEGKEMAFLIISDDTGSVEVVVFQDLFEKSSNYLEGKEVIAVAGRVNGEKIIADRICFPDEYKRESASNVHVFLEDSIDEEKLIRLRDVFIRYHGKCPLYIHTTELEKKKKVIKASTFLLIDPQEELFNKIKEEKLVGKVWLS